MENFKKNYWYRLLSPGAFRVYSLLFGFLNHVLFMKRLFLLKRLMNIYFPNFSFPLHVVQQYLGKIYLLTHCCSHSFWWRLSHLFHLCQRFFNYIHNSSSSSSSYSDVDMRNCTDKMPNISAFNLIATICHYTQSC